MDDDLLTVAEVAEELGITTSGVYQLIRRGRLQYEARSAHRRRVRRSVLEAYQRTFATPTRTVGMEEVLVEFTLATDLSPAEFERRWTAREIPDTDENARLWALARMLSRWTARERARRGITPVGGEE